MRSTFAWLLCSLAIGAPVACSSSTIKAPTSDSQYDDGDDPGTSGVVGGTGGRPSDAGLSPDAPGSASLMLPNGGGGIGFDELRFAPTLGKLLVPAGRTGQLDLLDPASQGVTTIGGFGSLEGFNGKHDDGSTSADEGMGRIFAIDHTSKKLDVVDPGQTMIIASAPLAAAPDYVRFAAATHEAWVTEAGGLEVFSIAADGTPTSIGFFATPASPESLAIDGTRMRAYTSFDDKTVAYDLAAHTQTDTWTNGCLVARGLAIDEMRGQLLVACNEGKLSVLDVAHGGAQLGSTLVAGDQVESIAYDASRARAYVASPAAGGITVIGIGADGKPTRLGDLRTAQGARCAGVDDHQNVYGCDPGKGALLVAHDPY